MEKALCFWLLAVLSCVRTDGQVTPTAATTGSNETNATTTTTTTTTEASRPEDSDFANRLTQSRLFHLWNLQRHVLNSLGWNSTPASIDPETRQRLIQGINPAAFVTIQKNCYYPICDIASVFLPDYMNRSIWFDNSSRHARYFFNIPSVEDLGQEITAAVVKLHLKRRQDCSCAFDDDQINERIHIKIYQYRRPVRSQSRLRHGNMRLIDAKMVTWDSARTVTLQVTDAVKRIARGRKNAGFEIQIKNMEEVVLDAKSILDPTVCTPVTDYDCTNDSDIENEESASNFSPVLAITNRISVINQGFPDDP